MPAASRDLHPTFLREGRSASDRLGFPHSASAFSLSCDDLKRQHFSLFDGLPPRSGPAERLGDEPGAMLAGPSVSWASASLGTTGKPITDRQGEGPRVRRVMRRERLRARHGPGILVPLRARPLAEIAGTATSLHGTRTPPRPRPGLAGDDLGQPVPRPAAPAPVADLRGLVCQLGGPCGRIGLRERRMIRHVLTRRRPSEPPASRSMRASSDDRCSERLGTLAAEWLRPTSPCPCHQ